MAKKVAGSKQNGTPKKRAMIEALENCLGIVTTACKKTGVARSKHYKWMNEDEDYAEAVRNLDNLVLDFGESQLHKQIKGGNSTATIFFLKTKGKKRGYIESAQLDVTTQGDKINNAPVMITMADAKKQLEELENNI